MIAERLKKVILKELELSNFDIRDTTQAFQVPGWDSLNHTLVLLAIEKEYDVRFSVVEVLRLKNVGDLQVLVHKKTIDKNKDLK